MIALLNDERVAKGKSTLGFVNPLVYAHLALFNDVTAGHNPGCGSSGFSALAGWDPVSRQPERSSARVGSEGVFGSEAGAWSGR